MSFGMPVMKQKNNLFVAFINYTKPKFMAILDVPWF
jgi:hypothetical protein